MLATKRPSQLYAFAMVDRGFGSNAQYLAAKRFKESLSTKFSSDVFADDVEDDAAYIGRGPTPRGVYEVIEGDTLCSIAGCFNLDVVEIIDKNGGVIKNPDELAPGDRIRIY